MKRLIILLLCLLLISTPLASGEKVADKKQVVLILWHGLEWNDLEELNVSGAMAYGLLNTRSGGGDQITGAYLTLGAGARAVGLSGVNQFEFGSFNSEYGLHTGLEPTFLVQPKINLVKNAQNVKYRVEIGALGTALAEANLAPRVLGNSNGDEIVNWAALVGMDGFGRIWQGNIGNDLNVNDSNYPYALRTNYDRLKEEVLQGEEALIIVELGDPYRYDRYQTNFLVEQSEKIRTQMVEEARNFVEEVVQAKQDDAIVFLLSPYPSELAAQQGRWLTPILCFNYQDGLLISPTTRWPGLLTNQDLAPTILELLAIESNQAFIGRAGQIIASELPREHVLKTREKIDNLNQKRSLILAAVVITQVLVYTATLLFLLFGINLWPVGARYLQFALLVLLTVPLGLLLWDLGPFVLVFVFVLLLLLYIVLPNIRWKIGFLALATSGVIAYDILNSSWLMRYSPLGYDPVGGARFYGLGNELMGVFIGTTIMAWAILAEEFQISIAWRKGSAFFSFVAMIILIGAPSLGTNVGGFIAAICAAGFIYFSFKEKKHIWRTGVLLLILIPLAIFALTYFDQFQPTSNQSHIGQTLALFRRDGFQALELIILRKLAMNLKLLRYSIWSKALLATLFVLGFSLLYPLTFMRKVKESHPLIMQGVAGVFVGSVAAFLFNDSGVVAAATCLSFASSTLLLLLLDLKHDFNPPETNV